ncbi:asparaginase [Candidatus Bathycorpusculum sp.]|uniref:asparaginase n=1 Tax=Candidatus Bathycorpusculum sp. TaxID=2994959 RepID=UPI0028221812|nr:asparaginase [Candidatus Termitimicrobium sp.]
MKPKIRWILCGGTIFMQKSSTGKLTYLNNDGLEKEKILKRFENLQEFVDITADDIVNLGTISKKDSSNLDPNDWKTIATEVADSLNKYDGVLITHGTDTMQYTSAALSFMIRNPRKTIAITGSQIDANNTKTDADKNLYDAARVAAYGDFGVCIVFSSKIIKGTRAKKTSATEIDAFESFCSPLLGKTESIQIEHNVVRNEYREVIADTKLDTRVGHIKVFPGMNPEILECYVNKGYRGIILEGFGSGHVNVVDQKYSWLNNVVKAEKAGIPVFICTQCNRGAVDLRYEVGEKLSLAGAVGLGDMLPEVAVIKLMHVLGHYKDPVEIKKAMIENFAGEINL